VLLARAIETRQNQPAFPHHAHFYATTRITLFSRRETTPATKVTLIFHRKTATRRRPNKPSHPEIRTTAMWTRIKIQADHIQTQCSAKPIQPHSGAQQPSAMSTRATAQDHAVSTLISQHMFLDISNAYP
jgi:hypothetical protein